jgi:hypothetical protein
VDRTCFNQPTHCRRHRRVLVSVRLFLAGTLHTLAQLTERPLDPLPERAGLILSLVQSFVRKGTGRVAEST